MNRIIESYINNGFTLVPLCWVHDGACACGKGHNDKTTIGKAPLSPYNGKNISISVMQYWFEKVFPSANVGVLLERSKLTVIDADSTEAVQEVESLLEPLGTVPTVKTSRGKHYYFRTDESTKLTRRTGTGESKKIDIFSLGCVVLPPSVHMTGHRYEWIVTPKQAGGFPALPQWAKDELEKSSRFTSNYAGDPNADIQLKKVRVEELPISDFVKDLIKNGEDSTCFKERGYKSRSELLYAVIHSLLIAGMGDSVIVSTLLDIENKISHKLLQSGGLQSLLPQLQKAKKNSARTSTIERTVFINEQQYQHPNTQQTAATNN